VPDLIKDLELSTVRCIGSRSLLIRIPGKIRIGICGARQYSERLVREDVVVFLYKKYTLDERFLRCNYGAIGVEKMDFVLSMDNRELTSSRGWTVITPIYTVFTHPGQFEVRRLS